MVALSDSPGSASTEPKRFGLLVEREGSGSDEGAPEFPDFARLSRLQFRDH